MMMILAFEGCHPFRDGNGRPGARGGGPGSCFSGCSKRHSLARARYTVRLCLIFAGWVKENQSTVAGIWATILEIFTAARAESTKAHSRTKTGAMLRFLMPSLLFQEDVVKIG